MQRPIDYSPTPSSERPGALPAAVEANDLPLAAELLRAGADPDRKDPLGYPPLCLAAGLGNAQMVEVLLTAGADPLLLDTRMGASALHKASQSGVVDVARLLIRRGAFIDLQAPTHGHTPLIDAAWHKRAGMVAYLLEQGAIPTIRAHQGYTALNVARRDDLSHVVRILEAGDEAIAERIRQRRLIAAVTDNDLTMVRKLIEEGADVNEKFPVVGDGRDGHTPLLVAARNGNARIARELLAAGANPRIVDWLMKATPGHKAGYRGHPEVSRVLAEGGVETDAQGPYNGYTVLHDAIWHGHTETAKVFLEAGARTDLKGLDGLTPLEMAREHGYPEIAELIEARASLSEKAPSSQTSDVQ